MLKKIALLFLLSTSYLFSQSPPLSENSKISVFTCGKGTELYSTFGHTAIRIKDSINQLDVVYNYGAFDFNTKNFYWKFVKGDLQYFINVTSYEEFIYEYQYDNREVIEQTLNFSTKEKQFLFDKLNVSLQSKDKFYTYKFIDRNCTTMIADKLNETIGKPLINKVDDKTITYREVLYPYFEGYFYNKLGINIFFGEPTDRKAEQIFLPIELLNSLNKVYIGNKPLVIKEEKIIVGNQEKPTFSFWSSIYFIALLLLIILIINKRFIFISYLFILGLLGLFFLVIGMNSFHKELQYNYNVMLFNPLFLLFPFLKKNGLQWVIIICTLLLISYCIYMISKPHLELMLPFIISIIYILAKLFLNSKKEIKPVIN